MRTAAFKDCDFAMLVGARPRGPGMERKDLLLENAKIFSAQGKALDAVASRDVRVLVVGNPANTNSLDRPAQCPVLGAGPLHRDDSPRPQPRPRAVGRERTGTAVAEVEKVIIWGNHSATQYPDLHHATVGGKPALVGGGRKLVQGHLHSDGAATRRGNHQGARHILGGIGRLCGDRSHARLDARHSRRAIGSAWGCRPTEATAYLQGVIYSYPVTCKGGRYSIVKGLSINEFSREKMHGNPPRTVRGARWRQRLDLVYRRLTQEIAMNRLILALGASALAAIAFSQDRMPAPPGPRCISSRRRTARPCTGRSSYGSVSRAWASRPPESSSTIRATIICWWTLI